MDSKHRPSTAGRAQAASFPPQPPLPHYPSLHLVNKYYIKLYGLSMDWLGDPTLLPKAQPLPHGQQGAKPTPTEPGEALPWGMWWEHSFQGQLQNPSSSYTKNQTDLLCLKFNGSDSYQGEQRNKEMERKDTVASKVR